MLKGNISRFITKIKDYWFNMILIAGVLLIVVSFSGCKLFPKEEQVLAPPLKEPPAITYETMDIEKGVFEIKTEGTGYFISVNQKSYYFKNRGGNLKQVYVATGDLVKKGDLLAEKITDNLESQLKLQEIVLEKAKMDYELAVASNESKYQIKRAELDVATEQLKLGDLQRELEESRVIVAVDGTVDFITLAKQGDYVEAFQTIVTVADLSNIQLEYTGDKINEFKLGMKVIVELDKKTYNGRVVMTPANMPQNTDQKIVPSVRIKLTKIPNTVKIGDSAEITAIRVRKENVIVIPKNLIHKFGGRNYVYLLANGVKKECDIETGVESQTEIEVIKGLNVGDKLIIE